MRIECACYMCYNNPTRWFKLRNNTELELRISAACEKHFRYITEYTVFDTYEELTSNEIEVLKVIDS